MAPARARTFCAGFALALTCCGNDAAESPTPMTTAGASGMAQATAGAPATQAGSSGTAGQADATGGSGTSGASGSAGSTPQPSGGSSGAGGSAAQAGAGGTNGGTAGAGGAAATKAWECPAGPFPTPKVMGEPVNVCMGFKFAHNYLEGPTWARAESALYFSNFDIYKGTGGDIVKYTLGGACELFTSNVGSNGLAVGLPGQIVGACQQSRSVESFDTKTKIAKPLASMYMGKTLDTPNDLVIHSNGGIYFTNRTAELDGRPVGFGSALFWIDPAGTLQLIEKGDGNGIALSPDERTLYVNNLGTWPLDEKGTPGTKGAKLVNGDGLAVDCAGNLYQNGGQILDPTGKQIGTFPGGTNMAFGGKDGTTLYVVSGGSNVRALQMNLPGIP